MRKPHKVKASRAISICKSLIFGKNLRYYFLISRATLNVFGIRIGHVLLTVSYFYICVHTHTRQDKRTAFSLVFLYLFKVPFCFKYLLDDISQGIFLHHDLIYHTFHL